MPWSSQFAPQSRLIQSILELIWIRCENQSQIQMMQLYTEQGIKPKSVSQQCHAVSHDKKKAIQKCQKICNDISWEPL